MIPEPEIFFHVGLSKTGSTFLQEQIFPKLTGIRYLSNRQYRHALQIIPEMKEKKILVSREFDQQFEKEVKKFARKYPNAHPVIVFREPGSWAVSNYKRFVKNGHNFDLQEFIDIENDSGHFKIQDFRYSRYIQLLHQNFTQKPLILLYEDLRKDPIEFISRITAFTNTEIDFNAVDLSPSHVSYNNHSLKIVRAVSAWIPFTKKLEIHTKAPGFLYNLYANAVRYTVLYSARLIPEKFTKNHELYSGEYVKKISGFFADEWNEIQNLARK